MAWLDGLWRLLYQAAIGLVLLRLSRFGEIRALYLRRGAAKGELRPGISDLDLTAVVGPLTPQRHTALLESYAGLAAWVPFLEKELAVVAECQLPALWSRPENRYRWREARASWKLLAGKSVLDGMPYWSEPGWAALHREVKVWLNVWLKNLLVHPWRYRDDVFRNATCYKFLGELLKIQLSALEGRHTDSRSQALAWTAPDHPWLGPLKAMEKARFLDPSEQFCEWTWRQLLLWLESFRAAMARQDYGRAGSGFAEMRLGQPEFSEPQQKRSEDWVELAHGLWGEALRGQRRTTCLCFPPSDLVLMLKIDPHHPPSLASLRKWVGQVQGGDVRPYLAFGGSALALRPEWEVSDNTWLTLQENPEAFEPVEPVGYNPLMLQFYSTRWGRLGDQPGLSEQDFASEFWWSAQLAVAFAHVCQQRLLVARSREDIGHELEQLGHPPPPAAASRVEHQQYLVELWTEVKSCRHDAFC